METATSNRQNSVGRFGPTGINRSSQVITSIIPAGAKLPIFQAGDTYYIVVATGILTVKPNNGSQNEHVQGTGKRVKEEAIFANIEVGNPNTFNVVVQIFVGFGDYIDNRLIISDPNVSEVSYPTAPVPNVSNEILIPDRSGQTIVDVNGNVFLAMKRTAVYITNLDLASVYNLYGGAAGTVTPVAPTILGVQPASNILYPGSGDFRMKLPAGNLNAVVAELYSAIRPT
jgi:hypothetical protein